MENGILDEFPNAVHRTKQILESIGEHDEKTLTEEYDQKGFKFGLTYNLIKVVKMSQTIARLENEIKELKQEKERTINKEKERAEKYRQKLIDMGVDPDK